MIDNKQAKKLAVELLQCMKMWGLSDHEAISVISIMRAKCAKYDQIENPLAETGIHVAKAGEPLMGDIPKKDIN